jgi:hypothetical protein
LFHSHYLLPIGRFPLEVTLELAAADAVAMTGPIKAGATGDGGADVNCSTTYEISNVRLLADTISLDGALSDNIDEALLQGKPLSIAYSSWSNQYFTLPGLPDTNAAWNVLINRSFSRLQSVFMNFLPTFTVPQREWTQTNTFTCWHGGADPALGQQVAPPPYNYARDQWRFQLQAGPHLWPSTPMNSFAESYYQLQKAVGQLISARPAWPSGRTTAAAPSIWPSTSRRAASTASSAGVTMSGLNTKASNDQIRLEWQGVTSDATANKSYKPSAVFVLCNYACVVELRAEGVIFAD